MRAHDGDRNSRAARSLRVLIGVIAYNEEASIEGVLRELLAFSTRSRREGSPYLFDIVVIDNASTDSTPQLVRAAGIPLVRHSINNGGSMGSVLTYLRCADQGRYDVLIQFDGDGQHVAAEIPKLLEPIHTGSADYVVGSRYLEREGFQSTFLRRIGIRIFNLAVRLACGERITDSTSGFRAYNSKVIAFFANGFPHELIDPIQLRMISKYSGARIVEVPVVMRERSGGRSEFDAINSLRFVVKGLVTVFACTLQRARLERAAGREGV